MVVVAAPPPARRPRPLHATVESDSGLHRIYDTTRHGTGPLTFRYVGPILRFDHHVVDSPRRGIYYCAPTLEGCVVEVFGDIGTVSLENRRVANPLPTRDLLLLDLRGRGAMRAGTVAAVAAADHALSQEWARYFYEHPEIYLEIDGLIYPNAHNGLDAIALYERAEAALDCPLERDWPLSDPVIETAVRAVAHENGLIVEES